VDLLSKKKQNVGGSLLRRIMLVQVQVYEPAFTLK
jgi:hypothetical protein